MSFVNLFRSDPGSGEAHHGMSRAIGGTTRYANVHALIHDAADFGSGSVGNVLNAISASNTLGTYVSCDGKTYVVFKVEYSDSALTRRFQLIYGDKGTTELFFAGALWEPGQIGPQNGTTGAATRVSAYYHGQSAIFPVYGFKEVTLWLLDGQAAPTVHVWGAAV